jgi:hypothetical protein
MSKSQSQQHGQRGERGSPGPRGPQGKRGLRGATGIAGRLGARGATGKTGSAGKLSPADRREILNLVHGQLNEVSRELVAQTRHMQSLRGELDELRANVASLIDSSS